MSASSASIAACRSSIPQRVTDELVAALKPRRAALWFAVHCNHARELAPATRAPRWRGWPMPAFPLMGQTVLLAGVNDDVETLDRSCAPW